FRRFPTAPTPIRSPTPYSLRNNPGDRIRREPEDLILTTFYQTPTTTPKPTPFSIIPEPRRLEKLPFRRLKDGLASRSGAHGVVLPILRESALNRANLLVPRVLIWAYPLVNVVC